MTTPMTLNIRSWNLNGLYDGNYSHPDFSHFFDSVDVFLTQETHCYVHDNIPVPDSYVVYTRSCSRPDFASPWGGVAMLIHSSIPAHVRDDFSSPDLLTVEIFGTLIMNAYVLPARSHLDWNKWTTTELFEFLCSKICLAHEQGYLLILLGDLNAQTGICCASKDHPIRISLDSRLADTCGKQLLDCLAPCDTIILNGSEGVPGDHFSFTEHTPHDAGAL
ncbi:hypothetical protein D9758_001444 [Tetrapyrgos nigripes]|uniref:Endonuclease/exonuclease/phosphatase domain-containing protein n=1 Tax=Tetrapyrgos nigripes TaxID=182062 RepID=A0A8H5GXT9_9AGAR|nr:hypothetical protein D9758_001444 [Tetrapyrgos nigripes]